MKDKNRIVIPTGHEPEEGLETPHFDAEETLLAARPVVPLTEEAREAGQRARAGQFATKPVTRRIPILALIIIAAVSVGLASGLAIGLYQGRQKSAAPVASQSSSTTTTVDTQFKQKSAPETNKTQLPAVQPVADTEQRPSGPTALAVPEGDPMAGEETATQATPEASDKQKPERTVAPDKKGEDEKQSNTPATPARRKAQDVRDNDDGPKKQKLPRRRPAVDQDREVMPRTVERANQELNRIRDIFEGPRP